MATTGPMKRWGLGGRRPPLYRLPYLIDRRQALLVEGEKAVERLRQHGFAATCPPTANKWRVEFSRMMWQAGVVEVCVLPDNDKPGQVFAKRGVAALHGYRPALDSLLTDPDPEPPWMDWPSADPHDPEVAPLQVKLIYLPGLPHRGDVVDWLDQGHSADELLALIDATPTWDPEAHERDRRERARLKNRERQRRFRVQQREKRTKLEQAPSERNGVYV